MKRVSSGMANNDLQSNLRLQESRMNKANNQIASQRRIHALRDDPLAAGHLIRYESYVNRLETFDKNAQTVIDKYSVAEGYMNQSLQIMQRVRELAVAGANGVYTKDDLKNMAVEVDELLKELISNANAVGPDGNYIFSGTRNDTVAFDTVSGMVTGCGDALITQVKYNGTVDANTIEIDERKHIDLPNAGNHIFWAEQQTLYSMKDASAYQVPEDTEIGIDGKSIKLKAGDNVYAIAAKINDAGVAVKASIDPVTNGLNLQTTDARQLWLEDLNGGSTFKELGIIKDNAQRPPYNLASTVSVSGGSLFDSVIALRDAMYSGDQETIGGRSLGAVDAALSNLTTRLAETGSLYERATQAIARLDVTEDNVNVMVSREGDLDFTKAITDMKKLEYIQQATLSTAADLYQKSLLNYMR